MSKSIFNKSVDVGRISFQELQYLLLAVYEYKDREPNLGKVQDKVIEKLSKLEQRFLLQDQRNAEGGKMNKVYIILREHSKNYERWTSIEAVFHNKEDAMKYAMNNNHCDVIEWEVR